MKNRETFQNLEPILGKNPESVAISNSEVQTFKRCRRRWMLGTYYGLGPKNEIQTGPLPLGTRVHNALEVFYRDGVNPVDEYNRLHRIDLKKFIETEAGSDEDAIKKFNSESDMGRIMLEGYLDWLDDTQVDTEIEFYSEEEQLRYRLEGIDDRVEIIAKIDARVRSRLDGGKYTLDHKTAAPSNFGDYLKYAYFSEQLRHYTLLERIIHPDDKLDGGIYNVLKKVKRTATAKPPFYERVEVRFNKKDIDSYWIRLTGVVRDIMRTRDELDAGLDDRFVAYPTQKMSWECGTCPFFQMCTMMDDGSDYEAYVEDHFIQIDPNERYNEDNDKGEMNG